MPLTRWRMPGEDQMIFILICVNAGMFILSILLNPFATRFTLNPFSMLSPENQSLILLGATGTIPIDRFHRWWSLISASYLHGGLLHILFNMAALKQLAPLIFQGFGTCRFMTIYTLGGMAGFLASYLAGIPLTIGASAALCALMGAGMALGKRIGGYFGKTIFRQISIWAISIFAFGLLVPGINNWGHAGGLLGGIVLASVLGHRARVPDNSVIVLMGWLCIIATSVILIYAAVTGVIFRVAG
ncbi:MAG: rhomboid family intramembrane serine protease [Desulfatirhabdiaceae bacterium]